MTNRARDTRLGDDVCLSGQYAAIRLNPDDNVATAIAQITSHSRVAVSDGHSVAFDMTVVEEIPFGHKFSLRAIEPNENIVKYGEAIGTARDVIPAGTHVHVHNVESHRGRGDVQDAVDQAAINTARDAKRVAR